jgi:ABC-type antimicrobial peptide transport system permease subunit
MYLMLRVDSASDAARIAMELPTRLAAAPGGQWSEVSTMSRVIQESASIRLRRFALMVLGGFAGLALILAAIGIYGVTTCAVVEQTKEIGVRIALGATRTTVFREVLGGTMAMAVAGVLLGSLASLASTHLVASMLFGIGATDGTTYLGVSLVLVAVVLLAGYLPARRATQVDPIVALRHE